MITKLYAYMLRHPKTKRGFWGRWYYRERYMEVLKEILKRDGTFNYILDVGCGEGLYAYYLNKRKSPYFYIGCDINKTSIRTAHRDPLTNYILSDVHAIPLRPKSVELVLCSEVLEHLSSPSSALSSICNVSSKYLIITFPDEPLKRVLGVTHIEHLSTICLDKIINELRTNGYRILKVGIAGRFFIPCGILEFLRMPRIKLTEFLVRLVDVALRAVIPEPLTPYRVVLMVGMRS